MSFGGTTNSAGAAGSGEAGAGVAGPELQSGSRAIPMFTSQPSCHSVTFPEPFEVAPSRLRVLATLVHPDSEITHDPSAVWTQSITATGFEVCVSEDRSFDGEHPRSRVDWVALVEDAGPSLGFRSAREPLAAADSPCRVVNLPSGLSAPVHLQATLAYSGSSKSANHAAAVWFESITATQFRLCVQQLENAEGSLASTSVDWFAYAPSIATSGFSAGEFDFDDFSDVQCETIATGCNNCENVQVRVNHRRRSEESTSLHGATLAWVEDFDSSGRLRVCAREISGENQTHDGHMSVDWLVRRKND